MQLSIFFHQHTLSDTQYVSHFSSEWEKESKSRNRSETKSSSYSSLKNSQHRLQYRLVIQKMIIASDHSSNIKDWESKIFFMTSFFSICSWSFIIEFEKTDDDVFKLCLWWTSLFCFRRRFQLNRFRQTFVTNKFFYFEWFFWLETIFVICISICD